MLYALKGNKEINILDTQVEEYANKGFDIYERDKKGDLKIKEYAKNKTILYSEYEKVLKELEALKKEKSK